MSPKEELNNFLKESEKLYNLSPEKILQILKESGHKEFVPSRVPLYNACIAGFTMRVETILRKAKETQEPCPVTNCTGIKVRNRVWPWICSIGGLRHHLAWRASQHTTIDINEMLRRMDELSAKNKVEKGTE